MSEQIRTRREVLTGVALGSGAMAAAFAPITMAQMDSQLISDDRSLSEIRNDWLMRQDMLGLDRATPYSPQGLNILLAELRSEEIVSNTDQELLGAFISQLSNATNELTHWFEETYNSLIYNATMTGKRIMEFAKGHLDTLGDMRDTDWSVVQTKGLQALGFIMAAISIAPIVGVPAAAAMALIAVGVVAFPGGNDDRDDVRECEFGI